MIYELGSQAVDAIVSALPATGDTFSFLANVATLLGLPFAAFEIRSQAITARKSFNRERRQKTLDEYNRSIHHQIIQKVRELDSCLQEMSLGRFGEISISTDQIEPDGKLDLLIRDYLSILEPFATGLNEGIYDLKFFDKLYGLELIKGWSAISFYPAYLQKRTGISDIYAQYAKMMERLCRLHGIKSAKNEQLLRS